MSNVVALPPRPGVPAAFAGRNLPDMNAAGQAGIQASFAVVKYKGSKWAIRHRGETKHLLSAEGAPTPFLDAVIVGISQGISKQFYDTKWKEGDEGVAPACFSVNGVHPDPASPKKQCETCAVCPQNVWGSKTNENGKKVKACDDRRRIAVVPYGDFQNEAYGGPMLLVLPPTSLVNLANYCRELQKFAAQPYFVRTKIGFDYNVSHPLITFTAAGWLTEEDAREVVGVLDNPTIERMLETEVVEVTHDPAVADPNPLAQGGPPAAFTKPKIEEPPPATAPAPVAPPVAAQAPGPVQSTPVVEEDEEAKLARQLEEARARKAAKAAQAAQAGQSAPPPPPTPEATVQPAPEDLNAMINNLLAG